MLLCTFTRIRILFFWVKIKILFTTTWSRTTRFLFSSWKVFLVFPFLSQANPRVDHGVDVLLFYRPPFLGWIASCFYFLRKTFNTGGLLTQARKGRKEGLAKLHLHGLNFLYFDTTNILKYVCNIILVDNKMFVILWMKKFSTLFPFNDKKHCKATSVTIWVTLTI